jgi:hypothetical protein
MLCSWLWFHIYRCLNTLYSFADLSFLVTKVSFYCIRPSVPFVLAQIFSLGSTRTYQYMIAFQFNVFYRKGRKPMDSLTRKYNVFVCYPIKRRHAIQWLVRLYDTCVSYTVNCYALRMNT